MNEYAKYLYSYILEHRYNHVTSLPEYQKVNAAYDLKERTLLETLTPEQKEQFEICKEYETALQEIGLRHMFQETLLALRGILCG